MSLYSNYIREKTTDEILETEKGFLTYRFLEDQKTVYIIDLYILPDWRVSHVATQMANEVVELAKQKGCTKLLGSVVPSNKNSTASVKVLLSYGMSLESSTSDFILFKKEI